jgi:hypothetical protein
MPITLGRIGNSTDNAAKAGSELDGAKRDSWQLRRVQSGTISPRCGELLLCTGTVSIMLPKPNTTNLCREIAVIRQSGTTTIICLGSTVDGGSSSSGPSVGKRMVLTSTPDGWYSGG